MLVLVFKGQTVAYNEAETRFYLIDPVLRSKGYDDYSKRRQNPIRSIFGQESTAYRIDSAAVACHR